MKTFINRFGLWTPIMGVLLVAMVVTWNSCKDDMEGKTFLTSDDLMIDDYIMQKSPDMTSFLDIADKAGFRGVLHAYGKYTCFIPTNDGVQSYLAGLGKSSVSDLSKEECAVIIRYHVVRVPDDQDSLTSAGFVDGRLAIPNMLAKYLTTRTVTRGTGVAIEVDRQAIILEKDIRAANGYIQKIDNVLIPPALTTGEQVANLPDTYSLFKSVMQKTGWVDSMSIGQKAGVWYTVFVQSDKALGQKGITTEDELLAKLRTDRWGISGLTDMKEQKKNDSLLWTFAAYHVVKGLNYLADLTKVSSLLSCAPNQAITFQLKKDSVLINEYNNPVSGVFEKGAGIDKSSEYTDYSCFNGVLVDVQNYIGPVKRSAMAVYWDVAEQPEFKKHPNFRKASIPHIDSRTMSDISFFNEKGEEFDYTYYKYQYAGAFGTKGQYVNHDYVVYQVYNFAAMEMKMPLLTEGVYNVWFCYRRDGGDYGSRVRAVFQEEGQADQVLNTWGLYINYSGSSDPQSYLNRGLKRYTAKWRQNEHSAALLFGAIQVRSTGRHTLRMEVVNKGTRATDSFLDMIHFIPIDDDQIWPRFDMDGKLCWPDTPCEEIFPGATQACPEDQSY